MNSSLNGHTQQHKLHFNAFCIIIWINNSTWGVILYITAGGRAASTGFSLSKSNRFYRVFIKLVEYVGGHDILTKFYNLPNPSRHSWIMALELSKIKVSLSKSKSIHPVFLKFGEYVDRHNISTKFYNLPNPPRHSWIMALELSKIKVSLSKSKSIHPVFIFNLVNMLIGIISRPSSITCQIPPATPEWWPLNCPKLRFRSLSQRVFIRSLSNLVNMLISIISRPAKSPRHSWIMALDLSKIKVYILGFWSSLFNEIYVFARHIWYCYIWELLDVKLMFYGTFFVFLSYKGTMIMLTWLLKNSSSTQWVEKSCSPKCCHYHRITTNMMGIFCVSLALFFIFHLDITCWFTTYYQNLLSGKNLGNGRIPL